MLLLFTIRNENYSLEILITKINNKQSQINKHSKLKKIVNIRDFIRALIQKDIEFCGDPRAYASDLKKLPRKFQIDKGIRKYSTL